MILLAITGFFTLLFLVGIGLRKPRKTMHWLSVTAISLWGFIAVLGTLIMVPVYNMYVEDVNFTKTIEVTRAIPSEDGYVFEFSDGTLKSVDNDYLIIGEPRDEAIAEIGKAPGSWNGWLPIKDWEFDTDVVRYYPAK